jgi:class 3 adenylate cyclase
VRNCYARAPWRRLRASDCLKHLSAVSLSGCGIDRRILPFCIDAWNERRRRSGDAAIRVAIGIHCGPVVQGDIGGGDRAELAVVGDTVNIARRVETCCRLLDAGMLVTAAFIESLREGGGDLAARFADFGWHRLRDCGDPIHLYGVGRPLPANYTSV